LLICFVKGVILQVALFIIAWKTLGGLGVFIPSLKPFSLVRRSHSRVDLRVRRVYPLENVLG
jgi:hypothetical protein